MAFYTSLAKLGSKRGKGWCWGWCQRWDDDSSGDDDSSLLWDDDSSLDDDSWQGLMTRLRVLLRGIECKYVAMQTGLSMKWWKSGLKAEHNFILWQSRIVLEELKTTYAKDTKSLGKGYLTYGGGYAGMHNILLDQLNHYCYVAMGLHNWSILMEWLST